MNKVILGDCLEMIDLTHRRIEEAHRRKEEKQDAT
jgi:hypothetical protein